MEESSPQGDVEEPTPAAPVEVAPSEPEETPAESQDAAPAEAPVETSAEVDADEPADPLETNLDEPTLHPDGSDQVSDDAPGVDDAEEAPAL